MLLRWDWCLRRHPLGESLPAHDISMSSYNMVGRKYRRSCFTQGPIKGMRHSDYFERHARVFWDQKLICVLIIIIESDCELHLESPGTSPEVIATPTRSPSVEVDKKSVCVDSYHSYSNFQIWKRGSRKCLLQQFINMLMIP